MFRMPEIIGKHLPLTRKLMIYPHQLPSYNRNGEIYEKKVKIFIQFSLVLLLLPFCFSYYLTDGLVSTNMARLLYII